MSLSLKTPLSQQSNLSKARKFFAKGDFVSAQNILTEIIQQPSPSAEAFALLGDIYLQLQDGFNALSCYGRAVLVDKNKLEYQEKFIQTSWGKNVDRPDPMGEEVLVTCLKNADKLDVVRLHPFWSSVMTHNADFDTTFGLRVKKDHNPANQAAFAQYQDFSPLLKDVFLLGVQNFIVHSPLFEDFITSIRSHLLADFNVYKKLQQEDWLKLTTAISFYVFYSEFILNETAEEVKTIAEIQQSELTAEAVAISACYQPLYQHPKRAEIEEKFHSHPLLARLIKVHIKDHQQLQNDAEKILSTTDVEDITSQKVRAQYEEFPYPRWKSIPSNPAETLPKLLDGVQQNEVPMRGKKIKILVAGCGTGEEICELAYFFPDASILGIDITRASLAYAQNKIRELGIKNITLRHADILKLPDLETRYDYITCSGVLHHMQDPVAGWNALYQVLKPGGKMRIALYSKIARRHILDVQSIAKKNGFTGTAESMKSFRQQSPKLLSAEVNRYTNYTFSDYYYLSMYRDMFFHVQEYNYTIPELARIMKEIGLEFKGFRLPFGVTNAYKAQYPFDPQMINLGNWERFEQENPDIFRRMYLFWCDKPKGE